MTSNELRVTVELPFPFECECVTSKVYGEVSRVVFVKNVKFHGTELADYPVTRIGLLPGFSVTFIVHAKLVKVRLEK